MSHHPSEETLALYASGDLDPRELAAAAAHMADCRECRATAGQFEALSRQLAEVPAEPSPEDLLEVRRRVLRSVSSRKKWRAGLQWGAGLAAAAALLLVLRPSERPRPGTRTPLRTVAVTPAPPMLSTPMHIAAARASAPPRKPRLRAPGLQSAALITRAGQAPLIKIATSDPNVIILLPPDTEDDERTQSNDE